MKDKSTRPERDKAKKDFYFMILFWVVLSLFFHFLNTSSGGEYWAIYPILSLALAPAIMGIKVFINELDSEKDRNEQLYLSELPQLRKDTFDIDRDTSKPFKKVSGDHSKWNDRDFV